MMAAERRGAQAYNRQTRVALDAAHRASWECKGWADKAEAMASYARQSADKDLYNMAKRIQAPL
jgi:hypothetical protein